VDQKSITSCSTSLGLTPNCPRNGTGWSACVAPWCEIVSMRTVSPDLIVMTGGLSTRIHPHVTVSGREGTNQS
jgi:hypothetical protein